MPTIRKSKGTTLKVFVSLKNTSKLLGWDTKQLNLIYAELYNLNKEPQKALDFLKEYVTVYPEIPTGYYQMALSYQQLGKNDKALESLKKCLRGYKMQIRSSSLIKKQRHCWGR
jgi:predicted Zn-dependent protease